MTHWIASLWQAAGAARQALLPYRDSDPRARAALDALERVLGLVA